MARASSRVIGYLRAGRTLSKLQRESLTRCCKEHGAELVLADGSSVDALMDLTAEVILDSGTLRRPRRRAR